MATSSDRGASANHPRKARKKEMVEAQNACMCGFCWTVPHTRSKGSSVALLFSSTANLSPTWLTRSKIFSYLTATSTLNVKSLEQQASILLAPARSFHDSFIYSPCHSLLFFHVPGIYIMFHDIPAFPAKTLRAFHFSSLNTTPYHTYKKHLPHHVSQLQLLPPPLLSAGQYLLGVLNCSGFASSLW